MTEKDESMMVKEEIVKQSFWQKHKYKVGRMAVEFVIGGTLIMLWFVAGSAYYSVRNRVSVHEYNVLAEKLFKTQKAMLDMKKYYLSMCKRSNVLPKISNKKKQIKNEKQKFSKLSIAKNITGAIQPKYFEKRNPVPIKKVTKEIINENNYWTCENDRVSETNLKNDGTFRTKPENMRSNSSGCLSYPHDNSVYDLPVSSCNKNTDIVLAGELNLCTQSKYLLVKNAINKHAHFTRSRFLKPAFDKFLISQNCARLRLNRKRTGLIYMCMPGCVKTGRWGVCKPKNKQKKQKAVDDFEL